MAGRDPSPGTASPGKVLAALLALYFIWGSTYLAMRMALVDFPPALMAGLRFAVAGAGFYAFLRARGVPRPSLREWRSCLGLGVLFLVLGNGGVAVAEQHVASSLAAVMVATMPLWAALFLGLTGSWPAPREWMGIVLGAVGVVVLNLGGDLRANPVFAAVLLLAAASWALGTVWSKRLPLPPGPMASAAQMCCAGAVLLGLSFAHGDRLGHTPSAGGLLALGYLIVFGSLVAFSAYGFLLRNVRATVATSYAYVNPAVAVLLGVAFAGERLVKSSFVGMGCIVAAVAIVALRQRAPVAPAARPEADGRNPEGSASPSGTGSRR